MRDVLAFDRSAAAVVAVVPDVGGARAREIVDALEGAVEAERAAVRRKDADGRTVPGTERWRLTVTGILAMADDVHETLVGGLVRSLALAALASLVLLGAVLRSVSLALLALVPNLVPLVLTFGFLGLTGIELKPSKVIEFSITLTIAEDDTIQFLSRFRAAFADARARGAADPHEDAARRTLRETGLPMFVTACSIAAGFASLVFSRFVGLESLGLLVGVSLFAAVFADLFLTPLLLMRLRPRLRR